MSFLAVFLTLFLISAFTVFSAYRSSRSLRLKEWTDLVGMLEPVPMHGIETVAVDFLEPRPGQLQFEPNEMWDLVGGWSGLSAMYHNTRIICALSAYAERWNFREAVIVTHRLRLEAWTVRIAIMRIAIRQLSPFSHWNLKAPFHLHEAAAAYYLMRRRVISLYETSHVARLPELEAAI